MAGGGTATDGGSSTDSTKAVMTATSTSDKMTETVSQVQYGSPPPTGAGALGAALHPGRRRRASMQDALDHTKINTSLYDPTLVSVLISSCRVDRIKWTRKIFLNCLKFSKLKYLIRLFKVLIITNTMTHRLCGFYAALIIKSQFVHS